MWNEDGRLFEFYRLPIKCKDYLNLTQAVKKRKGFLSNSPDNLIIVLNRDMKTYLEKFEFPNKLSVDGSNYEIESIIVHNGGMYTGHYSNFIKLLNGRWRYIAN